MCIALPLVPFITISHLLSNPLSDKNLVVASVQIWLTLCQVDKFGDISESKDSRIYFMIHASDINNETVLTRSLNDYTSN